MRAAPRRCGGDGCAAHADRMAEDGRLFGPVRGLTGAAGLTCHVRLALPDAVALRR
jgi:hypothetical protein